MNKQQTLALTVLALSLAGNATAQITLYENEGFRGRTFATSAPVVDFNRYGFNDRASSVIVDRGRWEVCDEVRYGGRCMVLRPGSYASLTAMGLNDRLSSVRPADDRRNYANAAPDPVPTPVYEYRRRPNERTFDAPVTSVRAVVGPPSERCWVEHQKVSEPARGSNTGGAVAGAIIGGILGHSVGGGSGRDLATVGGAVAGGMLGSNVGTGNGGAGTRDVRRCETTPSTVPAYWDVTYNFRGVEHQLQMSSAPGSTIAVNRDGEPRQ